MIIIIFIIIIICQLFFQLTFFSFLSFFPLYSCHILSLLYIDFFLFIVKKQEYFTYTNICEFMVKKTFHSTNTCTWMQNLFHHQFIQKNKNVCEFKKSIFPKEQLKSKKLQKKEKFSRL